MRDIVGNYKANVKITEYALTILRNTCALVRDISKSSGRLRVAINAKDVRAVCNVLRRYVPLMNGTMPALPEEEDGDEDGDENDDDDDGKPARASAKGRAKRKTSAKQRRPQSPREQRRQRKPRRKQKEAEARQESDDRTTRRCRRCRRVIIS